MDLTIKARAEINRFLASGERVPEGKKVVAIVPDYVVDPSRPGQAWPAVQLNTSVHGGRIEFVVDDATLEHDPLLRNIEPGKSCRIVIPADGDQ